MFSSRTPADLPPNRLTEALARRGRAGRPIVDLTESNPTRAGFEYPPDLLRAARRPARLHVRAAAVRAASTRERRWRATTPGAAVASRRSASC